MLYLLIDNFVKAVSISSDQILPPERLSLAKPLSSSDIPSITISLTIDDTKGTGLGRLNRTGDSIVENTEVIEVKAGTNRFSSNLKSLSLMPLPLKKNPSSLTSQFDVNDVRIRNVTETSTTVYQFVENPTQKNEYKLDVPNALVVFGEAQSQGEKLEVNHWTMVWKDEILGDCYRGLIILELWSKSATEADNLSRKLVEKLKMSRAIFKQNGFTKLQPHSLEPIEFTLHQVVDGSPIKVWKQKMQYTFMFESVEGGDLSSGMPIKHIDVNIGEQAGETMILTKQQVITPTGS